MLNFFERISSEEWLVMGTVIIGLFLFESGPKLLKIIQEKRANRS